MGDDEARNIVGQIGVLNRLVGSLESSVRHLTQQWERNDRDASEGRGRLHTKLDEVKEELAETRNDMTRLGGRLDQIASEVTTMKPQIATVTVERHEQIGSKRTLAMIATALMAAASIFGGLLVKLFDVFWPPKH